MTCTLDSVAIIDDLSRIRAVLLPHLLDSLSDSDYPTTETDATDDEETPTSESVARTAALLPTRDTIKKKISSRRYEWLRDCQFAFSPTLTLFTIAYDQHIVVSTARNKSSNNESTNLTVTFDTKLQVESDERITSVLCLPIASTTKRSTPDWTCIIVGFTTGYVRMYTEDGILLFSQIFHDKPVKQLKCHTQFPSNIRSSIEQPDELYIHYPSSILVVIDGLSLYQLLKVCRDHALKSTNVLSSTSPQLSFKKWGFSDQDAIIDFAPAGLVTDNRFDQFFVASMTGGYQAQIRSVPPLFTRFITIGTDPYCNFYYCAEGAQMPHVTEMAFALADKVKSSVMSAFSRFIPSRQNVNSTENRKPKIESETKIDNRFALCDPSRHGREIIVSPSLHLAAICDSFGRIFLYDIHRGIAIRMFKGYREAEIGFIQIEESTSRDPSMNPSARKSALFLVIHAPKRQLVEIWGCQQGARVAAFNVSKNSHLIYLEHFTLGWSNLGSNSSKVSFYKQCLLMEENGEIKTFQIPFHHILSDRNNQRAHDIMVVRQVRRLLKEHSIDDEVLTTEIRQQFQRLLSLEFQSEIFEHLFRADYLRLETVEMFLKEICNDLEKSSHLHNPQDVVHLQEFLQHSLNLLEIYRTIENFHRDHLTLSNDNDEEKLFSSAQFQSELKLTDEETSIYFRLFSSQFSRVKRKVHFPQQSTFSFGQFHSMFNSTRPLERKSSIKADDFSLFGSFLFSLWFSFDDEEKFLPEHFRSYLELIPLKSDDLVLLSLHSIFSNRFLWPKSIRIWKEIFSILFSINQKRNLIIDALEKTPQTLTALLLTLVLRLQETQTDFSLLIRRLAALVSIGNLFSTLKKIDDDFQMTVETIFLQHRSDFLLELITRRFVQSSIESSSFNKTTKENLFQKNLSLCREILPHTFEPTVLLIYSSWTSLNLWNKQISSPTSSNEFLKSSLDFYNEISIGIVKQNLGTLLWQNYFRSRIVALTQLIEKIGKIPKDRLCYKEIRLSENDLIFFLQQLTKRFFNTFLESIYSRLSEIPIFNVDDVWQTIESNENSPSLLELLMEQKSANGHLVLHHQKLVEILFYLMFYHLKSVRPFSLFDSKGIHAFFTDLHSHPLVTDDVDASVATKRQFFFSRLLNRIFEEKNFNEKIFDEILRLSTEMLVDHEYIRRHYITLLYANNFDHFAVNEENRIHDRQALAFQLLTIAGLRLNLLIEGNVDSTTTKISFKSLEIRAKISSTLKTWFASLSNLVDFPVQPCSLDDIETMLTRIAFYLPRTNVSQSNLAQEMLELVHLLKRSN